MMKCTIIFGLMLICSFNVNGNCPYKIKIFPKDTILNSNSFIIIESRDMVLERKDFLGLDSIYIVNLTSNNHTVKLQKIKQILSYGRAQAFFKPEEPLIIGHQYSLEVLNFDKKKLSLFMHPSTPINGEFSMPWWRVTSEIDDMPPSLLVQPFFIKSDYIQFGCGPAINSQFSFEAFDASEILVLVEFFEIETNKSSMYYLHPSDNTILVGRTMCGGEFFYAEDMTYKVRFKFTDICGNEEDQWSSWQECPNPLDLKDP